MLLLRRGFAHIVSAVRRADLPPRRIIDRLRYLRGRMQAEVNPIRAGLFVQPMKSATSRGPTRL